MNLIEKQAEKFARFKMNSSKSYQDFIGLVKFEVNQYSQIPHKMQFLETVMFQAKLEYEEHLPKCTSLENCPENLYYESVIFFLNELRHELSKNLTKEEFGETDILRYKTGIDEVLTKINDLHLGQQLTYDDFSDQFEEMKSYFYMNKKTWNQMLAGKLLEMVASGVVSETMSKEIVEILN
ncbi:MAG: hypothetical protein RL308_865 [Bacteroidota bacterium]|jgi:hypothetical protein